MKKLSDALPWQRLWKVGKPFWVSEKRNQGLLLLGFVLALLMANAAVTSYLINTTAGHFMTSIEKRNEADFWYYLAVYAGAIFVAMPVNVFYGYFRTKLALTWRSWLAASLFTKYFARQAYYKLIRVKEVDNPDQRMTQDVDSFCNTSVGLSISLLDSIVNVVLNLGVLWMLSPVLTGTVIGYSIFGSVVAILLGKALVALTSQQMKTEADLRFHLSEVRREAESVAMYRGEQLAEKQAKTRLSAVIETLLGIMTVYRNLGFFTSPYYMLVQLIPPAIFAPLVYFSHPEMTMGAITSVTLAFQGVFNGATLLIGQFGGIAAYAATINRVGTFIETVEGLDNDGSGKRIDIVEQGDVIVFDKTTISIPDRSRDLIVDLELTVGKGQNLLVTGPDGSGKTALLRVANGLWNFGDGKLMRPSLSNIMFIDKSPYLPICTLREAICYPDCDSTPGDDRLQQILQTVGLSELSKKAGGFDEVQNWREMLTPSQQQCLGLARIINRRPAYVIIDEAAAALEAENEKLLYTALGSIGSTYITAGNGTVLAKYHSQVLELNGDGTWKIIPASEYQPKSWRNFLLPKFLRGDDDEQDPPAPTAEPK